jgi:hypothetical protein
MGGKFSARAMQLATRLYQARGGGYVGRRPSLPSANSLRRWTAEQWDYAGRRGESRYLPAAVRARLTPSERRRTNAAKRGASSQWSRQPADVARKAARIRRALWKGGGKEVARAAKRPAHPRAPVSRAPVRRGRRA